MSIFMASSTASQALAANPERRAGIRLARGEYLWQVGDCGPVWQLASGVMRLDQAPEGGCEAFAGLVLAGDWLGIDGLDGMPNRLSAHALVESELRPVSVGEGELIAALQRALLRQTQLLAISRGPAQSRVLGLIDLLADEDDGQRTVVLPSRRDIADITALTEETVSRTVAALRREGRLQACSLPRTGKCAGFRVLLPDEAMAA